MTVKNPALYLQAEAHPAEDFRHLVSKVYGDQPGVFGNGMAVTQNATPNMSVDIAGGSVLVAGTEATYQGLYLCHNRGATNLVVAASDVTNARRDLVVAQVEDSAYSGAVDAWKLAIVTGTPSAGAFLPAVPANSLVLATILVGANVTTIVNANITDIRNNTQTHGPTTLRNRGLAPAPGVIVCRSNNRPEFPFIGMEIYETDKGLKYIYDGTEWRLIGGLPASIVKSVVGSTGTVTTSEVTLATISLEPGTWIISGSATPNASIAQDTEVVLSLFDAGLVRRTFTAHNYDFDSSSALGRASLAFTFVYVNPSTQNWTLTIRRTQAGGSVSVSGAHFVCQRIA